jgi:hypothetical protein
VPGADELADRDGWGDRWIGRSAEEQSAERLVREVLAQKETGQG